MGKYYAVTVGRRTGIFETWEECAKQVNGFSGATYKSFKSKGDAEKFCKLDSNEIKKRKRDDDDDPRNDIPNLKEPKLKNSSTIYNVYTDGGCVNNGRIDALAGIGVHFDHNTEYVDISEPIEGKQTNNRAELIAIIRALETLKKDQNVMIHSDSQYSLNGITGVNKRHKNVELFDKIDKLVKNRSGKTLWKYVKGHSGAEDGNAKADALATQAIKSANKG